MPNIHDDASRSSRVTAAFGHSALIFTLSKGAMLADLADRLDHPGRRHEGAPVAIGVKFGAPDDDAGPSRAALFRSAALSGRARVAEGWPIQP
jgi:hypothetical protein